MGGMVILIHPLHGLAHLSRTASVIDIERSVVLRTRTVFVHFIQEPKWSSKSDKQPLHTFMYVLAVMKHT